MLAWFRNATGSVHLGIVHYGMANTAEVLISRIPDELIAVVNVVHGAIALVTAVHVGWCVLIVLAIVVHFDGTPLARAEVPTAVDISG